MGMASVEHRRTDWFELFFDLVFVVTVAVLAQGLHGNPGWRDFGALAVLFFPAWWAWVNLMISVNLFGSAQLWNRVWLLAAMPGLGIMAAAAPQGLDGRAWAYALGAAWVRLTIFAIWWPQVRDPRWGIPAWRPISYGLLTAGLWALSALVPAPGRFVLWALAVAVEVILLTIGRGQSRQQYSQLAVDHLVERIGLFVVIVLGESVFAVVMGLSEHFEAFNAVAALGSFVTVALLAITFFLWSTSAAQHWIGQAQQHDERARMRDTVMYLPFLLIYTITILAAALGTAVDEPDHHLPAGSVIGLTAGVVGYYLTSGLFSRRLGNSWRSMASWLLPGILAPLAILPPAALLLPAWAAALTTAAVVFGLFAGSKLVTHRAR